MSQKEVMEFMNNLSESDERYFTNKVLATKLQVKEVAELTKKLFMFGFLERIEVVCNKSTGRISYAYRRKRC